MSELPQGGWEYPEVNVARELAIGFVCGVAFFVFVLI